jgi:hypothetical protein
MALLCAHLRPMREEIPYMKPTWNYTVEGQDLVIRNIIATCFGGQYDKGDDGQTESGVINDGSNPALMGVALPIRSVEGATRNSPLAFMGKHIPWGTPVKVWRESEGEDSAVECQLIDNGPNTLRYPTHALDLTPCAAMHFDHFASLSRIANEFEEDGMSFRVVGGAKWIS